MKLEDRLGRIMAQQQELFQELQLARMDVEVHRSSLLVRLSNVENRERYLRRHYRQAVEEGDPHAELLRELPEREHARAAEIKESMTELDGALVRLLERMESVMDAMNGLHDLQPLLIARIAAARSAGLGREVFDTLNDALTYAELALADAGEDGQESAIRRLDAHEDQDGDDGDGDDGDDGGDDRREDGDDGSAPVTAGA